MKPKEKNEDKSESSSEEAAEEAMKRDKKKKAPMVRRNSMASSKSGVSTH